VADRQTLIKRYADGYEEVCAALAGHTDEELDRRPAAGAWTAREIVHHLADSETNSYVRLRMLLVEGERYTVQPYDQDAFATEPKLRYDRPIGSSLAVLAAVRRSSTELLVDLAPEAFDVAGSHPEEARPYSIDSWLEIYAAHAHDHADQIRRARRGEP
jgi:hypothetical protein